jgi:hypothetical protein
MRPKAWGSAGGVRVNDVRYVAAAMGMAIAIAFMAPVPAYAGTTVFSDNFATKNTTLWKWGAGASVSNGQLVLACNSNYDGQIVTPITYDLTDSAFTAQFIAAPDVGNGTTETGLIASIHSGDVETASVYWEWVGGTLLMQQTVNWNYTAYYQGPATAPAFVPGMWVRIRHSSATGSFYWEKSPDGTTWTTLASAPVDPAIDVTKLYLVIECGYWTTETSGPAIWTNASLVQNAPVSPPPPP